VAAYLCAQHVKACWVRAAAVRRTRWIVVAPTGVAPQVASARPPLGAFVSAPVKSERLYRVAERRCRPAGRFVGGEGDSGFATDQVPCEPFDDARGRRLPGPLAAICSGGMLVAGRGEPLARGVDFGLGLGAADPGGPFD
jgi:hypothetical protein